MLQLSEMAMLRITALALCALIAKSVLAAQRVAPPPTGKLVDVGGYRVHLYCIGEGTPTVFIVGGFSFDWDLVQPGVARFARVCTYDVSGSAWSDAGPSLTCLDRVDELHRLLKSANIDRPFVFVGFSIGALVGRLYDVLYPGEVAGMVMVDHAFLPLSDIAPKPNASPASADGPPVLVYQTPIVLDGEDTSNFDKLPKHIQELHRWAVSARPALRTAETAENCVSQLANAEHNPHPFGNTPLVVISTGNDSRGYRELQQKLSTLSIDSKQVFAEKSFHSVEIDQPQIVIGAIRQALEAVRNHKALQ